MDVNLLEDESVLNRYQAWQRERTLLFENNSFTPRPELLCIIVLYSPSSSSLRS